MRHQYRWVGGLKPPFSLLVQSGTGCWEFTESGAQNARRR